MEIRESQIEDILVNSPKIAQEILGISGELRLIGRQMPLPSGRLDVLYSCEAEFILLELKVANFENKFITQILDYKKDLTLLQNQGKLLNGGILPYLLIPNISKVNKEKVEKNEIVCQTYDPSSVLDAFFNNIKTTSIASIVKNKPIDIGVWNIHLINELIYELEHTNSVSQIKNNLNASKRTIYNKIKFSHELGLINWKRNQDDIFLSDLGKKYIELRDLTFGNRLSEKQTHLIKNYVVKNPYHSSVVLGIASMVECVFILAKNTHPVPIEQLTEYFTYHSGKIYDWKTEKARYSGMRMYSNYSVDLGLLAKTNNFIYITPEGLKFTLQMQMHKGIKMIDNLKLY